MIYNYHIWYEIGYNHWLTTIYGTFTYHHNIISLKTSSPPVHCTVFLMKVVTVLCHSGNHTEHKHLQLWSSRHLCVDRPKQPLTHLPRSQQRPLLWPESAAHSWASHLHSLHYPRRQVSRQDRSKCTFSGLNLLYVPGLILNCGAVTAIVWMAPGNHWTVSQDANAPLVLWICCIFLSWSCTAELLPPMSGWPQADWLVASTT